MLVTPWKKWLLLISLILGFIYALPNIFGEEPVIQINHGSLKIKPQTKTDFNNLLKQYNSTYKDLTCIEDSCTITFTNTVAQLKVQELLQRHYGKQYNFSLNLIPKTPKWLQSLGAQPMKLGLDLRGGVELIMLANVDAILNAKIASDFTDLRKNLNTRELNFSYTVAEDGGCKLGFTNKLLRQNAQEYLSRLNTFVLTPFDDDNKFYLTIHLEPTYRNSLITDIMDRALETLRNRINELGISEAIVQRQGHNKIIVEMPGIQDPAYAKEILGKTATLEFTLLAENIEKNTLMLPKNVKRIFDRNGRAYFIEPQVLLKGEAIISAVSGWAEGTPVVYVKLDNINADSFALATTKHVGRSLAVILKELNSWIDETGKVNSKIKETFVSAPTILEPLGGNFRITGLNANEARDIALILRSGAMPVALSVASEHIVGPSLGQENITKGIQATIIGLALVVVFMGAYYSLYGMIANITLLMNLVLLVAIMSIFKATLSLPGIAGIVLTLGMAVDANVLIFERIREELRNGQTKLMAIKRGFVHALATIIDSNITTLIVALVLFVFSSGPIRGFAVTLSIGILTSVFTSIIGTQALIALWHNKHNRPILIGI